MYNVQYNSGIDMYIVEGGSHNLVAYCDFVEEANTLKKILNNDLSAFLTRIKNLANTEDLDTLKSYTIEELGEVFSALIVESGLKNKTLKETALQETIDLFICVYSLFVKLGGTPQLLKDYGNTKLDKWQNNIESKN